MSKVKINKTHTTIESTEIEYPIYVHYQDEDAVDNFYIRITESKWTTLSFEAFGGAALSSKSHNKNTPVPEFYLNNLTTSSAWDDATLDLANYLEEVL